MIINNANRELETSEGLQVKGFSIDINNAKAFDILSSALYKNKPLAIIRELSCNAYDAHVAAGKKDTPIHVHLPTQLEPFLSIRDEGTGMAEADIMSLYSTYFASTKTASNDFVGAFGLGSKSPFSYVDSFTVTSIFNGRKSIYSAFKNDKGVPSIAKLHDENTNSPNGVEVNVPVKNEDVHLFVDNASKFYSTFKPFPSINLSINKLEAIDVIDDISMYENNSHTINLAIINIKQGNVVYPLDLKLLTNSTPAGRYNSPYFNNTYKVIIDVPIGSIEVTAGREEISYTKSTIDYLRTLMTNTKTKFWDHVKKELSAYPSLYSVLTKCKDYKLDKNFILNQNAPSRNFTYKGKELVLEDIKIPVTSTEFTGFTLYKKQTGKVIKSNTNVSYITNNSRDWRLDIIKLIDVKDIIFPHNRYYSTYDNVSFVIKDKASTVSMSSLLQNNAIGLRSHIVVLEGSDPTKAINDALEAVYGEKDLFKPILLSSLTEPVVYSSTKAQASKGQLMGFSFKELNAHYSINKDWGGRIDVGSSLYRGIELSKGGYYITGCLGPYKTRFNPTHYLFGPDGLIMQAETLGLCKADDVYLFQNNGYKTLDKYSSLWVDLGELLKNKAVEYSQDKTVTDYHKNQDKGTVVGEDELQALSFNLKIIKDPLIRDICVEYKEFIKSPPKDNVLEAKLSLVKLYVGLETPAKKFSKIKDVHTKYPLISMIGFKYHTSALVPYMNAVYQCEQNKLDI